MSESVARYIDTDELKGILQEIMLHSGSSVITIELIEAIIDNACTTVDVIDVKHGKWILVKGIFPSDNNYKCSNCGTIFETGFKFCPNCGADMKGETK